MINIPTKIKQGKVIEAETDEIWIRANENVHRIAKKISDSIDAGVEDDGDSGAYVNLACIGAACVNQAMKAVAVARESIILKGFELLARPFFSTITDDKDRERTRLMIHVERITLS